MLKIISTYSVKVWWRYHDTDNMDDKNLLQEYNTSEIYRRKQVN